MSNEANKVEPLSRYAIINSNNTETKVWKIQDKSSNDSFNESDNMYVTNGNKIQNKLSLDDNNIVTRNINIDNNLDNITILVDNEMEYYDNTNTLNNIEHNKNN